jgi:hypothetical protein
MLDGTKKCKYNQFFGCAAWQSLSKETEFHESITLHSQALRQVPHCAAQGAHLYHLRKSQTQAATGIGQ